DLSVVYPLRIITELHDFRMASIAGADLFISGTRDMTSHVSRLYLVDPGNMFQYGLNTPEATATECDHGIVGRNFCGHGVNMLRIPRCVNIQLVSCGCAGCHEKTDKQ